MGMGATTSNNAAGANTPSGKGAGIGSPQAQGMAMYSQPYMMFGGYGSPFGMGGQGMYPGPYSYQPFNPQTGYNPMSMMAGMQNYYTPIPNQMPQSPFLAGYTWGGNAPPANPAQGSQMPLAPMQVGQVPNSVPTGLPGGMPAAPATPAPAATPLAAPTTASNSLFPSGKGPQWQLPSYT